MKLTTHSNLGPGLRMHEAMPQFPYTSLSLQLIKSKCGFTLKSMENFTVREIVNCSPSSNEDGPRKK
jgi:hypothetical protein